MSEFLSTPDAGALTIISGHALSVQDSVLDGGFIRDCLILLASPERKGTGQLSEMVRCNYDEPAVADTHASKTEGVQ